MSRIVIDCKGHILGRLSAIVAKELLHGHEVALVRCEKAIIGGAFRDVKAHYLKKMNKRTNFNHLRGPFHFRAPAEIVRRTIRGMIPYKTVRGSDAMSRLRVYDGIPPCCARYKRVVCPSAMAYLCLRPERRRCEVGRVAHEIGWQHAADVERYEKKRLEECDKWYQDKVQIDKRIAEAAEKDAELQKINAELAKYGY